MTIAGFEVHKGFARDVAFDELLGSVVWEQKQIRMFGKMIDVPRLSAWYGTSAYTYSGITHAARALPTNIDAIRIRTEQLVGTSFNSVLANLYRNGGDSVSWHSDDEPELGPEPVIASLSFGAARRFGVRSKNGGAGATYTLEHGDLVVMSGRAQLDYQHAILKCAKADARINLTFRVLY